MDTNSFGVPILPSKCHVEFGVLLPCQKWPNLVVNGLVRGVSVPTHFLNDTNILYISHVMCANTWKP